MSAYAPSDVPGDVRGAHPKRLIAFHPFQSLNSVQLSESSAFGTGGRAVVFSGTHFLRRTGAHFVGKCCENAYEPCGASHRECSARQGLQAALDERRRIRCIPKLTHGGGNGSRSLLRIVPKVRQRGHRLGGRVALHDGLCLGCSARRDRHVEACDRQCGSLVLELRNNALRQLLADAGCFLTRGPVAKRDRVGQISRIVDGGASKLSGARRASANTTSRPSFTNTSDNRPVSGINS